MAGKQRLLVIALGALAALLVLTPVGLSYTEKPTFCTSCHVMKPMYDSWKQSSHQSLGCNECHAPKGLVAKIAFKATSGTGHLYEFNFGEIPQNIRAKEKSREIIQQNCFQCHQELVQDTKMGDGRYCFECHRYTPHGRNNPGEKI